jgi:hypothetical protein
MRTFSRQSEEAKQILGMDSWRVFRILSEFVDGFETLGSLGPSITLFGSARSTTDSWEYTIAFELSQKLSKKGFAVITGGGPGVMEAANKGAHSVDGYSCGLNISVPYEENSNPYVDPKYSLYFRHFFVRKVLFIRYAKAVIVLPGGLGSLDELFEVLTLIQTKRIKPFPLILMGKRYWQGLIDWLKETVLAESKISQEDLKLFTLTDDPEEVCKVIENHYREDNSILNF